MPRFLASSTLWFVFLLIVSARVLGAIAEPILVVDTNTPLPDGSGVYQFPYAPAADNGSLSFKSRLSSTQIGIFQDVGSGMEVVPGSVYQFHFDHSFNGAHVAFRAKNNNNFSDGLYTNLNGAMSRFVSKDTPLPVGSGTFGLSLEDPYISNGIIIFKGRDPSTSGAQSIWQFDGTTIQSVVSFSDAVPGGIGSWRTMRDPAIDERGTVVFLGDLILNDGSIRQGIYKKTGSFLQEIAGPRIPIPGGTGNFEFMGEPSIRGGDVAFRGRGSNGQTGIYAQLDGVLTLVADLNTPIPDGPGSFTSLNSGLPSRNNVVFVGLGGTSFSHRGIYIRRPDGLIEKVIDNASPLDGKTVSDLRIYKQSLDDTRLYFQASFADGSSGIYRIDVIAVSEPPVADAGTDQIVPVGDEVQLSGVLSQDDNTSAIDLEYDWQLVDSPTGTTVSLDDSASPSPTFTPSLPGMYQFSLTVTDADGQQSNAASVVITVELSPAFVFERLLEGGYSYSSINDQDDGFYSSTSSADYWVQPGFYDEGLLALGYRSDYSYDSNSGTYTSSYERSADLIPFNGSSIDSLVKTGDPSPTIQDGIVKNLSLTGIAEGDPLVWVYSYNEMDNEYDYSLLRYEPATGSSQALLRNSNEVPIANDDKVLDYVYLLTDSLGVGSPIYSGYDRDTCYEYRIYSYRYFYSYCSRYLRGLYSLSNGEAQKIVDTNDAVPGEGTDIYFYSFSRAVNDDSGAIVFAANWRDSDDIYRSGLFEVNNGVVSKIIDSTTEGWDRGYISRLVSRDGQLYLGGTQYKRFVDDTGASVWASSEGIFTLSNGQVEPLVAGGSASSSGYDFGTYEYSYLSSRVDAWNFDAQEGILLFNRYFSAYNNTVGRYESSSSIVWKEDGAERKVVTQAPGLPIDIEGKGYDYASYRGGSGALKGRSLVLLAQGGRSYISDYDPVEQRYTYSNSYDIDVVIARFDTDRDGVGDDLDNCPMYPNAEQEDVDQNGIGDVCEDSDSDSVPDLDDNCPLIWNEFQENSDLDDFGDACDLCVLIGDDQSDIDGDGLGDACDDNSDNDSIVDTLDNCPFDDNELQENLDQDGLGDVCDPDVDGDGIANNVDGRWDGSNFIDQSRTSSVSFSDHQLGGISYGRISNRGGLEVDVRDAPLAEDGVIISATVGTGTARYRPCGYRGRDAWVDLEQGVVALVNCGSISVEAILSVPRVVLDDEIVVEVLEGASIRMADLPNGDLAIENTSDAPVPVDVKLGADTVVEVPDGAIGQIVESEPGQYEIQNDPESTQPIVANVNGLQYVFEPGDVGVPVKIDIKPGSADNSINLGSNGVTPVAILSSSTFDATEVDPLSVTLASAPVKLRGKGKVVTAIQDFDDDGIDDLMVHVETSAIEIEEGTAGAVLKAKTFSGVSILGTDSVRVVPE